MPAEYQIDTELGVVFSRGWDELTQGDVLVHHQRLIADPDFDPALRQLIDLSAVTHFSLSPDDLRALAPNDPWDTGTRRAIAVPSDYIFGMARMYEARAPGTPQETAIFKTLEEARDWLRTQTSFVTIDLRNRPYPH